MYPCKPFMVGIMINLSYLMKWAWSFENIAYNAVFRSVLNIRLS